MRLQNCYKSYKGVIVISRLSVKLISAVFAVIFCFGSTVYAFAQSPANIYNGGVSAVNDRISKFDIISSIDDTKQENSSIEINVTNVKETSAVLTWQSENLYLSYTVLMYNPIYDSWEDFETTNENSIKLTHLADNTEYQFGIKSSNSDEFLGSVKFKTQSKTPVLKISSTSAEKIELVIENVDDDAVLTLYKGEDKEHLKKTAKIKAPFKYTDTKVEQGTAYYYQVQLEDSKRSKVVCENTLIDMGLPDVSGKTKTYAYYTAVTAKSTPQYKLLNSDECYTDEETGIRMVDDCYCIALGSFYGSTIGTKYKITLSSGNSFNAILCDQKSNRHTDENHQYAVRNKDIVEFYVEKRKIPKNIRGDYGRLEQFKGKIVKIEKYV